MERSGENRNNKEISLRLAELEDMKVSSRCMETGSDWKEMDGYFDGAFKKLESMDDELCIIADDGESERAIPLFELAAELGRYYEQDPLHMVRWKVLGGAHGRKMDITTRDETVSGGYLRLEDGEDGTGMVLVETHMEPLNTKEGGFMPAVQAIPLNDITALAIH